MDLLWKERKRIWCGLPLTLGDFEIKNIKNVMDVKEQLSALVEIQRDQKRVYTRENISGNSEADHDDYM